MNPIYFPTSSSIFLLGKSHIIATITKIPQAIIGKGYATQIAKKYKIREILPFLLSLLVIFMIVSLWWILVMQAVKNVKDKPVIKLITA